MPAMTPPVQQGAVRATPDTQKAPERKTGVRQRVIRALGRHRWCSVVSDRTTVNRTNHEERRHRGDGEVSEPGQR